MSQETLQEMPGSSEALPVQPSLDVTVLGLKSNYEEFRPKTFKVEQEFLHCAAAIHSDIYALPKNENIVEPPTKAEVAFIEKTFCDQAKRSLPKSAKVWTHINKNTFLMDKDEEGTKEGERFLSSLAYRAVLISYEGLGNPFPTQYEKEGSDAKRPAFHTEWKRFFLSAEHPSHLRFRWSKVELWNDPEYEDPIQQYNDIREEVLASEKFAEHADHFRLYNTTVQVYILPVSFRGMVSRLLQTDYDLGRTMIRTILHAFLLQDLGGGEKLVVHGRKIYDGRAADCEPHQGRMLVNGSARHFGINSQGKVIQASEPVANYFFPDGKVSDFMGDRFGNPPYDQQRLDDTLRGKLIRFTSDGPHRGICEVPRDMPTPNQVKDTIKAQQWLDRNDFPLEHPNLPVLALRKGHDMVPPEMVRFVPMQSCGLKVKPMPIEQVPALKLSFPSPGQKATSIEEIVLQRINKPSQRKLDMQFERLFGSNIKPNLLFVEVNMKDGVSEVGGSQWKEFDEQIHQHPRVADDPSGRQPLSLVYDEQNESMIDDWQKALNEYTAKHAKPGRRNFIIAAMPTSLDHNATIYRMLKTACDTKIGIQSFFVGASTLCQDSEVPKSAAGNVLHRMRLRNPTMLSQLDKNSALDLAVAVHIGPITPEGPFLFVMVARNMATAENYHTEVALANRNGKEIQFPMNEVVKLLDRFEKPPPGKAHRITVFRSGFMFNSQPGDATPGKEDRTPEEQRILKGVTSLNTLASAEHKLLLDDIRALKSQKGPIRSSYILVGEQSSFGLAQRDARALAAKVKHQVGSCGAPSRAVVFASLDADTSETFNTLRHINAKDGGKLVTLNLIGGRLPLSEDLDTESEESPGAKPVTPDTLQSAVQSLSMTKHGKLERLAKVFSDDHLGLYDTKWPIPTHLAHLAMLRASQHVVRHKNLPAPVSYKLPSVPREVADSLYYL